MVVEKRLSENERWDEDDKAVFFYNLRISCVMKYMLRVYFITTFISLFPFINLSFFYHQVFEL